MDDAAATACWELEDDDEAAARAAATAAGPTGPDEWVVAEWKGAKADESNAFAVEPGYDECVG